MDSCQQLKYSLSRLWSPPLADKSMLSWDTTGNRDLGSLKNYRSLGLTSIDTGQLTVGQAQNYENASRKLREWQPISRGMIQRQNRPAPSDFCPIASPLCPTWTNPHFLSLPYIV